MLKPVVLYHVTHWSSPLTSLLVLLHNGSDSQFTRTLSSYRKMHVANWNIWIKQFFSFYENQKPKHGHSMTKTISITFFHRRKGVAITANQMVDISDQERTTRLTKYVEQIWKLFDTAIFWKHRFLPEDKAVYFAFPLGIVDKLSWSCEMNDDCNSPK